MFAFYFIFRFVVGEIAMMKKVIERSAGDRDESIFEFIEVPDYFCFIGCEN